MRKIKNIDNLIIGSGVSGLSFAYFLGSNNYLIIEKDSLPGGLCKTTRIKEFTWDYSGHFFHFKDDYWKKFFINVVGKNNYLKVNKNTKICINDKLIDYPFQSNIHQLPKKQFADCISDLYFATDNPGSSFLEMIRNRYGASICDIFLQPYNEKLYSCDLNTLDKNSMGRFFPRVNKDDIFTAITGNNVKSYNDHFLYPIKGCQEIIDYFIKYVSNISYSEKVLKINVNEKIVETNLEKYKYKNLICSAPMNYIYPLIEMKGKEDIGFSYNKVKVFNIGFNKTLSNKSCYNNVHWVYFPEKKYCFYRVGFYNFINPISKLSIYVEVGFSKESDCSDINLDKVLCDLQNAGIIDGSFNVDCFEEILMNPAYVHIEDKTSKQISSFLKTVEKDNMYFLGRYGKWIYCSIEDCLSDSKELAERLLRGLDYE